MKKLLLLIAVSISAISFGQATVWKKIDSKSISALEKLPRDSNPTEFDLYEINLASLKSRLAAAPTRNSGQTSTVVIAFPNAEGQLENFRIYESSQMHPDLASRFPEIQGYVGEGIDDKSTSISFSTTLFGLHTMTLAADKSACYIDPYSKDLNYYMVYSKANLTTNKVFSCGFDDIAPRPNFNVENDEPVQNRSENGLYKTYRLAFSCTIEYAAFHVNAAGLNAGTLAQKKAAVLAAQNVTMARINPIYEKDFAIKLVIIANNIDIINIVSDDLDNENSSTNGFPLLGQNQALIDTVIGDANYDIGHVATTGAGGVASQGPCQSGSKAKGVTGIGAPVGDPYDIDYVAHEMGHQFGAAHTYNNSCAGNVSATSAFEPGSGSTIMAYAGICPPNVQNNSDAYFHARSIIQVQNYINGSGNCVVPLANNNAAPVITAIPNYTIPIGTPFALTANATDADGDILTYCWEQYNANSSTQPPLTTATVGPNYRSLLPSASPTRFFPKLSDVLAGTTSQWEVTPTVARSMLFRVMVRDNELINGGQTKSATTTITFNAATGPFTFGTISGRNTNSIILWNPGETRTINWNVNNTNTLPGGANVNIKLSIDGGLTFPYDLALNTANDGTEDIIVPVTPPSLNCRLKIEATANVFYTINSAANPIYTGYSINNECFTYNYTGAAFAIPNGTGSVTKTIAVPISNNVTDVNVTLNATHTNLQNLIVAMTRPGSGTQFQLYNQQCSGSSNMNVTFDQQSPALVCASPTIGSYAPSGTANLNALNVNIPAGNFSLNFRDVVIGSDSGTVNSMSVTICRDVSILTSLAKANFDFENFILYPNPNNGEFTLRFSSIASNKITVNVVDLSGRKIFEKSYSNSGLFDENIQLNKPQAGIYLVTITDGDKKITKRIVVE